MKCPICRGELVHDLEIGEAFGVWMCDFCELIIARFPPIRDSGMAEQALRFTNAWRLK